MATLHEAEPPPVQGNPALLAVLVKRGLVDQNGRWFITDVSDQDLGPGPKLDPDVVEKFASLDTTRNLKVLEWMLFAAGGGNPALIETQRMFDEVKEAWQAERKGGHGDNGSEITPMSEDEAREAWNAVEPEYRAMFWPGDQDMMVHYELKLFGYGRFWPGLHGVYEKVYEATKTYLDNMSGQVNQQSKVGMLNQARMQRAEASGGTYQPVKTDISRYETLAEMEDVNAEFYYFFKRGVAKKDVQFVGRKDTGSAVEYPRGKDVVFYDDPNIRCYVPATAAAMLKVGYESWCVANDTEFNRAFSHDPKERQRLQPRWDEYADKGPFMVIHFKGDVSEKPELDKNGKDDGVEQPLKRLAVLPNKHAGCDLANLKPPYEGVHFFDKRNRNYPKPVDWQELVGRLAAFENGGALVKSVEAAMHSFSQWLAQMKPGDIKMSVYEFLALRLVRTMLDS